MPHMEKVTVSGLKSLTSLLGLDCLIRIVDVGANRIDGVPPYRSLLDNGHGQILGFEPNPEALAKLNQDKGPNETYLPLAVGDGRRHRLRFCHAEGMTSLLEPNPEVLSLFHGFSEWSRVIRTEAVDTVRLDDIEEAAGLDLLKIDIQGAELMVFENAVERLRSALVVHTEVEFLPMYVGQPLYPDIDRFLSSQGMVLHRFYSLTSRAVRPLLINNNPMSGFSQLLWADVIFIRDFTKPHLMTPEQLIKLAVILHDCYRSYDVVLHLLRAHDHVVGTKYGECYLDAISKAGELPVPGGG